jgi:Xaa-Pro aminopeptidase
VLPASVYEVLQESFPSAHFEDASHVLHEAMVSVSRESEEELSFLSKAVNILDECHKAIAKCFKPGVKEYELWAAVEQATLYNGGWYPHFILVGSGPNPVFLRAPASPRTLNEGDLAFFEVDSIYRGISPQSSFAFSLGIPGKELINMCRLCEELYAFALEELEKQRTFLEIELDIAKRIHNAGYEPATPQMHRYNSTLEMPMNKPPQPGDYFTVHPNVSNPDCTLNMKSGDTVRINKEGKVERLSKIPAKLHII